MKSIIDRDLHFALNGKTNSIKSKKINVKNYELPNTYWYLSAGYDFPRIEQVYNLASVNNLTPPQLFVLTDNRYIISRDGRVSAGDSAPNHDQVEYLQQHFNLVQTFHQLQNFKYSTDTAGDFLDLNYEEFITKFLGVKKYEEDKNDTFIQKGFSGDEIDLYWSGKISEEELIARQENPIHKEFPEMFSMIFFPAEKSDNEKKAEQLNRFKSFLEQERQIAALYKHKEYNLFLLLLAVDNLAFAKSEFGQQTYGVVGEQNWGHDADLDAAACKNYKVLFQLSARGRITPHREDIRVVDTPGGI